MNVMELIVEQLMSFGFFDLLIFLSSSAIFYAFFTKSKLIENKIISSLLSLSIGFSILAYKFVVGISVNSFFSVFFMQVFVFALIFLLGAVIASIFYPDLPKMLMDQFKRRTTLFAVVFLILSLSLASGLLSVVWTMPGSQPGAGGKPDMTTVAIVVGLIIFIIVLIGGTRMV